MNTTSLRWLGILYIAALLMVAGCSSDESGTSTTGNDQNQSVPDAGDSDAEDLNVGEGDGGEDNADQNDVEDNQEEEEACNPVTDEDCPCRGGQFKLCSSAGDPTEFPANTECVPGYQRCERGEWADECLGEHIPDDGDCFPDTIPEEEEVEECDGFIDEYGECIEGFSGEPADENVFCADGDPGIIGDPCTCEVPEGGEEYARQDQPCYTGPADTLGVGECRAGTRDCRPDGTWGPCEGQVLPESEEICGNGLDNTCTGIIDEGCDASCPPGVLNCAAFQDGYLDIPCPDGNPRNDCGGCEEVDESHSCGDGLDNTCSGRSGDQGCPCDGASQPCYPGPHETAGVGVCEMGVQHCEGETWGPCEGYVLPTPEQCGPDGLGNGLDNNCSGVVDEGCAGCVDGDTRSCGTNVGECEQGIQTCEDGEWGSCEGGVQPQPEVCDGKDNSCNGIVDDDLKNACGQCEGPCYTYETEPTTETEFDEGLEFSDGNDPDNTSGKDGVTLSQESTFPSYLWAANSSGAQPEGGMSSTGETVSKVSTDTGQEEARYWVGQNPSRTAVDLDGNVWVTGRSDGRLTKILWNENDCDPNQPTSQVDADGNVNVVNSEADPLADGCVVFSMNMSHHENNTGQTYGTSRAVAVDAFGDVWVGYSDSGGAIQRINPSDFDDIGDTIRPDGIPTYAPDANGVQQPTGESADAGDIYGLVADSQGYVYASVLWGGQGLPRFNPETGEWDRYYTGFNCAVYGIAVDADDRIWMGCSEPSWGTNHDSIGGGLAVFDPSTKQVTRFFVPDTYSNAQPPMGTTSDVWLDCPVVNEQEQCGQGWRTTAVGVEPNTGDIWATGRDNGYLLRLDVDEDDFADSTWSFIPALRDANGDWLPEVGDNHRDMRGIGFDNNGMAWHLGMGSRYVFLLDPGSGVGDEELSETFLVGDRGHYTYSDFTGSSAFNFTAPRGIWRYTFDSGIPTTMVDAIDVEATVPDTTTLGVRIRPLDGSGTPSGGWQPAPSGGSAEYFEYPTEEDEHSFDLVDLTGGPLSGEAFELEVRMTRTDHAIRPYLHDLDLQWHWP